MDLERKHHVLFRKLHFAAISHDGRVRSLVCQVSPLSALPYMPRPALLAIRMLLLSQMRGISPIIIGTA